LVGVIEISRARFEPDSLSSAASFAAIVFPHSSPADMLSSITTGILATMLRPTGDE